MSMELYEIIAAARKGQANWASVLTASDVKMILKMFGGEQEAAVVDILDYLKNCGCCVANLCDQAGVNGGGGGGGGGVIPTPTDPNKACVDSFMSTYCTDDYKERFDRWIAVSAAGLAIPLVSKYPAVKAALKLIAFSATALSVACESKTLSNDAIGVTCWVANVGLDTLSKLPLIGQLTIDISNWLNKDGLTWIQQCCGVSTTSAAFLPAKLTESDLSWIEDATSGLDDQMKSLLADAGVS